MWPSTFIFALGPNFFAQGPQACPRGAGATDPNPSCPKFHHLLKNNSVYCEKIGITQKNFFEIDGEMKLSIKDLLKINNQWYNKY